MLPRSSAIPPRNPAMLNDWQGVSSDQNINWAHADAGDLGAEVMMDLQVGEAMRQHSACKWICLGREGGCGRMLFRTPTRAPPMPEQTDATRIITPPISPRSGMPRAATASSASGTEERTTAGPGSRPSLQSFGAQRPCAAGMSTRPPRLRFQLQQDEAAHARTRRNPPSRQHIRG